jgi:acetolactate synthase-1/2/3 large subunit
MGKLIKVSDYVIKFLEKKKITTVFTVSGGGSIFLCDALYKSKKIKYVSHHHEQAASFAAESYARTKKSPGCCLVTTGPGGTNALTGVACAWIDSVPVIFISGQVFLNQTILKSKKRQVGVQEIDIISMVKSSTKFCKMILEAESIEYYLEKAYHTSIDGRPGPVWLDIPADIQNAFIDETKLKKYRPKKKQVKKIDRLVKKISLKLKYSKQPVIHLGGGARQLKSQKILKKFFRKNKIPFILTWNADDLFSSVHDLYAGKAGAFGERGSNFIIQNCDFYLSIGTRLPYMVTGYNTKDFAKKAKFKAMVDIDKNELKKSDLKLNLTVESDSSVFLEKLFKNLINYKPNFKWLNYCKSIRKKYPTLIPQMIEEKKYVNSYYFVKKLSEYSKKNDSIITDMGFSFTTSHQAMDVKQGQTFFTNSGHAPMGWGLPAAIGNHYANIKNKKTKLNLICLTGEGGLQMNIQELATVMHNKIPIKIFIFNNGGYLTIKQTQQLGFNGRIMGADNTSGLSFPNYKKISESHKIKYFKISNHTELNQKLKIILNYKGAFICELMMNPNEEQIPKAINKRGDDGKSIPTTFEDMYPFLSKDELISNNLD